MVRGVRVAPSGVSVSGAMRDRGLLNLLRSAVMYPCKARFEIDSNRSIGYSSLGLTDSQGRDNPERNAHKGSLSSRRYSLRKTTWDVLESRPSLT